MENGEEIIMEYGQYLDNKKNIERLKEKYLDNKNTIEGLKMFSSCDSNSQLYNQPKRNEIDNNSLHHFLNTDGLRFTTIDDESFPKLSKNKKSQRAAEIVASNHYGKDKKEESFEIDWNKKHFIECEVKNKITLKQLCDNFKGKEWESISYNILSHNCQHFVAKIIEILKAVRINEKDKIRSYEKLILPNCIISALWDNEKLSVTNTIGRIPIIGFFYDAIKIHEE
jgi:hypothetical protein